MHDSLRDLIASRIRAHGPITAAEFIDLALYHPRYGYYSTAPRRSGRHGDFYTSADVGPLFGATLAAALAEMWAVLRSGGASRFDLVEAGAGNGRLMRDILDAAADEHPEMYDRISVRLVERSQAARRAQAAMLGPHAPLLAGSSESLPERITGVVFANELLDACPPNVVVATTDGLHEIGVSERGARFGEVEGPLSEPGIAAYLERIGARLEPGWRAEVNLAAMRWIQSAAAAIDRGFLLLFDFGHEAHELFSATHAGGTLTAYRKHTGDVCHWLEHPGECDIASHVDFTSARLTAEEHGLIFLGGVDQTYFLLALGIAERAPCGSDVGALRTRLGIRTLVMPGGLGSAMKALAFGRGVGQPGLTGFSSGRMT